MQLVLVLLPTVDASIGLSLAKIRKMDIKRDVPPNTVAKMMSNMMYERRYFPLLTQVIVGGVVDKPVMYTLDPLGSVLPDEYAAVGTGAEMALGVLDPQFKPNMSKDDAINLAKRAVRAAALRDSASGDGLGPGTSNFYNWNLLKVSSNRF